MTIKLRLVAMASALAAAIVVTMATPVSVHAQTRSEELRQNATEGSSRGARSGRRERGNASRQSPAQILAAAQEQANIANIGCQVTEANLLGQSAERTSLYEIACSSGPGYLIASSTPPTVTDCVLISAAALMAQSTDPQADTGPQCTLPANADTKGFIMEYGAQAGVTCTVDDGAVVGRASDGGIIYEIGCNGADGFHIKKLNGTWTKEECLQVLTRNAACRFTTPAEQATTVQTWLVGSDAAACNVQQARLMGQNDNGRFYEVKCGAGDGYIARVNADHVVQQIYPCATAQAIGGGCTLTSSPAPAAAPVTSTEQ